MKHPTIVLLDTGLFPDGNTVRAALKDRPGVTVCPLAPGTMDDADWDQVLARVLAASLVVTV